MLFVKPSSKGDYLYKRTHQSDHSHSDLQNGLIKLA